MTGMVHAEEEGIRLEKHLEILMKQIARDSASIPRMSGAVTELKSNWMVGYGKINLLVGRVGIGSSAGEATSLAIETWYKQFGIGSIADRKLDVTVGSIAVRRGGLGIRGQAPAELPSSSTFSSQNVLSAVSAHLPRTDGNLHAVHILVAVSTDGTKIADCRIDGQASSPAAKLLMAMPWPAASYLYKHSYVLKAQALQ